MTGLCVLAFVYHCVLCILYWIKFPHEGKKWTLGMRNSMEIPDNPENVVPGFWILSHPNTILFLRPSGN